MENCIHSYEYGSFIKFNICSFVVENKYLFSIKFYNAIITYNFAYICKYKINFFFPLNKNKRNQDNTFWDGNWDYP